MDRYGVRDLNAPWYSGLPTFARAPTVAPDDVPAGDIAVVGIPVDEFATSSQRQGMRWGPRRIREASLRWPRTQASVIDDRSLDILSGRVTRIPERMPIVDTGDTAVVHSDIPAQIRAIADHVAAATRTSGLTVSIGGDHFVTYPAVLGFVQAWRERKPGLNVGYLQLDTHTDFLDERVGTGRFHHGTMARRISEIPEVSCMAWYGISTGVEPEQFELMRERDFRVFTAEYVRRVGPSQSMLDALAVVSDVDVLYVSVDIDVVTNADAPATGSYTFEGLTAHEFLEAVRILAQVENLRGLDLVEVAPEIDGGLSRRTELLAASALYAVIGRRLLDHVDTIPSDELRRVFRV